MLSATRRSSIGFSPDGRWLVSSTLPDAGPRSYHFWRVGTWEPGLRIDQERNGTAGHPPAFTRDGRLMALGIAPDQVLLADPATGRELARLTTLQPVTPTPLVFSPDGTKLVASTNQKTVLVWDLRRIRDQLAPMGLDWDAPPYPTVPGSSDALVAVPPPRPVRVIGEVIEPQPAPRRTGRDESPARRQARRCRGPDPPRLAVHPAEEVARSDRRPGAGPALRPDDTDALFLLAEAYSQANNLPAARATLEKYLAAPRRCRRPRHERSGGTPARPAPGGRRRFQQGSRRRPRVAAPVRYRRARSGSAWASSRTPWRTSTF